MRYFIRGLKGIGCPFLLAALITGTSFAQQQINRPASAVVFVVNSARDGADLETIDGSCDTGADLPNATPECTFRAAIQQANATSGTDSVEIRFQMLIPPVGFPDGWDSGDDLWTITPNEARPSNGPLPEITRQNVHVRGETQAGSRGFPNAGCGQLTAGAPHTLKVFLDGSFVSGPGVEGVVEFAATASGSSIRGLAIGNGESRGVHVDADAVVAECLYLGSEPDGETEAENYVGITYYGPAGFVLNNLVSGNEATGVEVAAGASGVIIEGNVIGLKVAGTDSLPNNVGVNIRLSNDIRIGGVTPTSWNLISGNSTHGISLSGDALSTIIEGNRIGTNLAGNLPLPNGQDGVNDRGTDTRIGASTEGAGNLISGNVRDGIGLYGTLPVVEGNLIGTNLAGTAAIPNTGSGIRVGVPQVRIGGVDPGAGNVVSGNGNNGITIRGEPVATDAPGTLIVGNFIGADITGTIAVGNQANGILDYNDQFHSGWGSEITGNLISGNLLSGIKVDTLAQATRIRANIIGLDITGTTPVSNQNSGVTVAGKYVMIGGDDPGEGNFLAGNDGGFWRGDVFIETVAENTRVRGNFIGTDVTGTSFISVNLCPGVVDQGTSSSIGAGGPGNLVGNGVYLYGNNTGVANNYIGTNVLGNAPIGNNSSGIHIQGDDTWIFDNLISGNAGNGILVNGNAVNCTITSNLIGTDASGTSPVGNVGNGVSVLGTGTQIGLATPGDGNTIAFNGGRGVSVETNPVNVPIIRNAIYLNGMLGIDLSSVGEGPFGETVNDPNDSDTGPNELQNYPVLPPLVSDGITTTVSFELNSTPHDTFRVELFRNTDVDPSGFGEGQVYTTSFTVVTDVLGYATIAPTPMSATLFPIGSAVTATATRIKGGTLTPLYTSEFSNAVAVEGPSVTFSGLVFLEGPYVGPGMATGVPYQATLPSTQPYLDPLFDGRLLDYDALEVVAEHPLGAVDWIVLSLRTSPAAGAEIARRVAFVADDGQILDLDGSIDLQFGGVSDGLYYVVVCQRNHICAMSDGPVSFGPSGFFDFTSGSAYTAGPAPMKHLGGGVYGLHAGDANADEHVQALDFDFSIRGAKAGLWGYEGSDFNLDGVVDAADVGIYVANTVAGASSQVP